MKTTEPIYNGKNLRQILQNLPKNIIKAHRKLYISNCLEVYKSEKSGSNKGSAELARNANFNLINFYLINNEKK